MHKRFFILTLLFLNQTTVATFRAGKTPQTLPIAPQITLPSKQALSIPAPTPQKITPCTSAATVTPITLAPQAVTKLPAKRVVSITNNINPEMLVYKHWSGDKVPEPFAIVVDGKPLEPGKTTSVALEDDKLNVQFNYSFMMGYRKGTREVTFKVPEKQDTLNMTFSWDNDHRIILDKAQAIEKREI